MTSEPTPPSRLKQVLKRIKPYLRWVILGGTLYFVLATLHQHWQEVTAIRIGSSGWRMMAAAFGVTLLAHIWSGWVWSWILRELNQPAGGLWGTLVYLRANIAKYLPGNVWHFYGRIMEARAAGFSGVAATLSVLMEPLLMAAAALMIALMTSQRVNLALQVLSLVVVLGAVHPRLLNPLIAVVGQSKKQAIAHVPTDATPVQVRRYPLLPLLGELIFVTLRGAGFLLTVMVIQPLQPGEGVVWFNGFSIAWLLGLVIPGAPGGIGVFEGTAIALLGSTFTPAIVLSVAAIYRLVSTLAECAGAGLGWLGWRWGKLNHHP